MSDDLRIQQIRQFLIAAESGNFRSAASATFRSAGAVSAAMRALEQVVGGPLFEEGQRARLTPLGHTLRPLFAELLTTHDRVLRDAQHVANAEGGSVSIAVVPFLAEEWLPKVLRAYIQAHPSVRVRVTDERSRQIRLLVADGTVDIGIGAKLVDDPKLRFHPVALEEFGVVCRKDHPLARAAGPVTWKSLSGERLIGNDSFETIAGYGLGEWIVNPIMSVSTRPSMVDCVRQGVGITVSPALTKPEWADDLAFVPLIKPRVTRLLGIMTRQGQTLLPIAASLFEIIEQSLRQYAQGRGAEVVGSGGRASRSSINARDGS